MSKRPEDHVVCSRCALPVTRRNYSRHCRTVHGAVDVPASCRVAYSSGSRSRSSSCGSPDRGRTPSGGVPADAATHTLMLAATAVLDQHHSFTEPELIGYLADCYPEVPEEFRRPLVLGAVAGAQRAAHMYVVVEKNKASADEEKRGVAANSACALSFWNMGLRTPSRTPASSRCSSLSAAPHAVPSLPTPTTQPVVLSVDLANLQLPVSLHQSHRDLEEAQQAAGYQSSTYEIVAAAPPDAPLLVSFDALGGSGTTANVEPYVPAVLPGSQVVDMPYIPSSLTQQPTQSMDVEVEPDLSIETPADPALFEPPIETESEKKRDIQKREEVETKKKGDVQEKEESEAKKKKDAQVKEAELKKKNEEAASKKEDTQKKKETSSGKADEGSKKTEESSSKNKDVSQKKGEGSAKRKEDRDPDARRNVDRDPAGSVSESSGDRRRTSPRRALPKSTPRCESPPHTVSGWEWREFLDFRRRTSTSRPAFKRYKP